MSKGYGSWIERALFKRNLARWAEEADRAGNTGIARLKTLRKRAWSLRSQLDRLIAQSETRLRPAPAIPRPLGADWLWRPDIFTQAQAVPFSGADRARISADMTLFHDCALAELGISQIRGRDPESATPFALQIDVFEFRGGFLSLAIDLPEGAVQGLRRKHVIMLKVQSRLERQGRIFARLNVRHGPNAEQMLAEVDGNGAVEFDLVYSKLNEARVEKMWLDLIFEDPRMNRIVLQDLTMIRRPRAEI